MKGIALRTTETKIQNGYEAMTAILDFKGIEYVLEMIKSVKAPEGASFLVTKVRVGNKLLWSFKNEQFRGFARFEEIMGIPIICLFSSDWKEIKRIIPLEDLHNSQRIMIAGEMQTVTSRDILEILEMKQGLADKLKVKVKFSENEKTALVFMRRKEEEKEELARQEKKKVHEEKIARIINRPQVSGYDENGFKKYGYPVVGDEWQLLPSGIFVVVVESYNNETGECGELIEAFEVARGKGGKPEKKNTSKVFRKPVKAESAVLEGRFALFEINGTLKEVVVYQDMADVHTANKAGLNSGMLVTTEVKDEKGRHQIYSVTDGEIKPVCHASPLV